ncbi:EAL domain-containing protein [Neptuniibacter caesariensis]|uniref:cyclic-guanylate-specific phosphodiesterase n=1 Tax=Neptuniibacter caesariensis TaxID=207954 RepID=A0A7U8C596_NEPCE|nr:EAL domain-containing protein [Neptuniibacter caesariensis]EAR61830.1 PAS sensor diguanylate cyclase/phosphodiesterase [Oceanospirillum sp. MED92] [Neptuniibacter caesariensis]
MQTSKERSFFSLRWKVFINLMLVLAVVHLGYGFYSYYQLTKRVEQERGQAAERDLAILEGLVDSSYDRLVEVAEIIPKFVEEMKGKSVTAEDYVAALDDFFPGFLLNGSLDAVYLYDSFGGAYNKLGIKIQLPVNVISGVLDAEEPVRYFHCREDCLRFVAVPVRLGEESIGVLVVGRALHDIILDFKSQSGRDIGLAVQPRGTPNSARLWKLDLKYLTQKTENITLLNKLVNQFNIPAEGGIFELDNNGRSYQIVLEPPQGAEAERAYWILIDENTKRYEEARQDLLHELFISGVGLLIAAIAQLAFLRAPFRTISDVSEALPLLANSAFEEIRKRLGINNRSGFFEDELDLLKSSTVDLSYKLERLETSLLERAQNLTERSVQLEAERDLVTSLLDTAEAIIITQDDNGRVETLNRFGQQVLGISESEAKMMGFLELNHETGSLPQHRQLLAHLIERKEHKVQMEASIRSSNGQMLQISWLHSVLSVPGGDIRVLTIGLDLTERMHAEKRLVWMANHDPLTALPNRLLFTEKVDEAIKRYQEKNGILAILFCDLDSFKDVNDSLGHPVGDELLQQAAERIQNIICNDGVLARLGGDEFTVLLEGRANIREIENVAQHIIRAFRQSFFIDGYEIFSTISIGISLHPDHGDNVTSLIQHADVAMFDAKESGKNQLRFYHDEQGSQRYERFSLVNDLRRALEKDEFRIFYQPQIDTRTGNVMGVEALLRWQHSEAGMISPAKFIPLAEEQGLIVPIGEWVLRESCRMGKIWHDQGMDFRIGVNIAGQQIMHESLMGTVQTALDESGIRPHLLDLEVTENFLLKQPEITIPKLHKFREMGLSLSMDDFGTGFSSLSYLKKLPINTLKIDQSFVRDIGSDPEGEAIVKAIIVLAKSLGLEALAEGVETSEQLSYLRTHGCHLIQGYYFSRPLPAEELPDFVMNQAVEISFE